MAKKATCLGSGIYNLDIIVNREYPEGYQKQRKFVEKTVIEDVGGTCGNVMSMLPYLGVQTYPLAILDDSDQGNLVKERLELYGANTRFVKNDPKGGTTILRCTHKLDKEGNKQIKFRATSPGSRFPKRKQLNTNKKEDVDFLESLDFVPDVFFFDDPSAAHITIAKGLRKKGTLVYFEPEGIKGNLKPFLKRVKASDIVKYSSAKITDDSWTEEFPDKIFIKTMSEKGVAFKFHGGDWITVPAVANDNVVDWEGAGDWTTSAFIAELAKADCLKTDALTEDIIRGSLEKAQVIASRSVSFLGSKGMIQK